MAREGFTRCTIEGCEFQTNQWDSYRDQHEAAMEHFWGHMAADIHKLVGGMPLVVVSSVVEAMKVVGGSGGATPETPQQPEPTPSPSPAPQTPASRLSAGRTGAVK